MTVYRVHILTWIAILVCGLATGLASLYISQWLIILFFGVILSGQFFLNRIVCPVCGTPITYQGRFMGLSLHAGVIHKNCQHCGCDLDQVVYEK